MAVATLVSVVLTTLRTRTLRPSIIFVLRPSIIFVSLRLLCEEFPAFLRWIV